MNYLIKTSFESDITGEETPIELKYLAAISNRTLYNLKKKTYIYARQLFVLWNLDVEQNIHSIEISHFENGKPYFLLNDNLTNIDLSLSHTKDLVCVGMAKEPFKVGVDIEHLDQKISNNFASFFLTVEEIKLLRNEEDVIVFWSLKESFFKALGVFFSFKELQIATLSQKVGFIFSDGLKSYMTEKQIAYEASFFNFEKGYVNTFVLLVQAPIIPATVSI